MDVKVGYVRVKINGSWKKWETIEKEKELNIRGKEIEEEKEKKQIGRAHV